MRSGRWPDLSVCVREGCCLSGSKRKVFSAVMPALENIKTHAEIRWVFHRALKTWLLSSSLVGSDSMGELMSWLVWMFATLLSSYFYVIFWCIFTLVGFFPHCFYSVSTLSYPDEMWQPINSLNKLKNPEHARHLYICPCFTSQGYPIDIVQSTCGEEGTILHAYNTKGWISLMKQLGWRKDGQRNVCLTLSWLDLFICRIISKFYLPLSMKWRGMV